MKAAPPVVLSRQDKQLVCDVAAVPGWEGFESLRDYLERKWSAVPISGADGPDARRCVLQIGNATLALEFEHPWGSRIVSLSSASEGVLGAIAADLEQRLAGIQG